MFNNNINLIKQNEYILLLSLQELYSNKIDTTTSWAQKFIDNKNADENSIFINAFFENEIKKVKFTKKDLNNISDKFNLVRIYNGESFVNLICKNEWDGIKILQRIEQLPEIKKMIFEKLNLNLINIGNFKMKEIKAFAENINKIYSLEIAQKNDGDNSENQMNPKTDTNINSGQTRLILKKLDTFINHNTYINKINIKNDIDMNNSANCLNYYLSINFNFNQINNNDCMINSDNNIPSRIVNKYLNTNNMYFNGLQNMGAFVMQNNMKINY